MGIRKPESIWQHQVVLPYILDELKEKIEQITPVYAIYLFGSRAKTPVENWHQLEGKDWDILVIAEQTLRNTHVWTTNKNYHIDLFVVSKKNKKRFIEDVGKYIELFPTNHLDRLMDKNKENEKYT